MQARIAGSGYDWGSGSLASNTGLPGTIFVSNGVRYVQNADGSVVPLDSGGMSAANRYYDDGQNYGINEGGQSWVDNVQGPSLQPGWGG